MATMTVDCGSFDKYSYNGATAYGTLVNFSIPAGATITGCSVSFTTHASGGNTSDRAFSLNGARAHSGWASAGALNAYLLKPGNNTFRATLKSTTPGGYTVCWWDISGITLTITYTIGGGSTPPPVGGGGPVVISPSSINAGAGSVTVTCPAEPGIWHMVNWTFGTKSGQWSHYWETGGTGTISIPLSWIEEMPNAASGILAIRVRRSTTPSEPYSYATDKTTNITIKVPASVVPTISDFTASLIANGVDPAIDGYVQAQSKVALSISATAGDYSSISKYKITGGGLNSDVSSGTFGPFDLSGDITFTAKVTDARGRSASRQVAINILPYTSVSAGNVSAYRSDSEKGPADEGQFVALRAKIIYSELEGQNVGIIEGCVYEKGTTPPSYTPVTSDELTLFGGSFSIEKSYTAEIKISDLITSHVYTIDIPTGTVIIGITTDGDGVSFGTYPEAGKVKSAWPIYRDGNRVLTEADCPYAVGDILQTLSTINPADRWASTEWTALDAGRFLAAAGTGYAANSTGGAASVTLSIAEIPPHDHVEQMYFSSLSGVRPIGLTPDSSGTPKMMDVSPAGNASNSVTTQNTGGGGAHENRPPYLAVYMWLRTA